MTALSRAGAPGRGIGIRFGLLKNLPISFKLTLVPALILLQLVGLAGVSWYFVNQQSVRMADQQARFQNVWSTVIVRKKAQEAQVHLFRTWALITQLPPAEAESLPILVQRSMEGLKSHLDTWRKQQSLDGEEQQALADVVEHFGDYEKSVTQVLDRLTADHAGAGKLLSVAYSRFDVLNNDIDTLEQYETGQADLAARQATENTALIKKILVASIVSSVIIALLVTVAVRRSIMASIQGIRDAALELKSGDLTKRVKVEGSDEIAQAAHAFNDLIENFQSTVRDVLAGSNSLAQASSELARSSETVAEGTDRQSAAAAAVAGNVQQMTVSIGSISDSAQGVRETSKLSMRNTEEGGTSLSCLQREIQSVMTSFVDINSAVGEFVDNTRSITTMTQQVKDLADQTNLLALNAAIEAARAGQQGRGFAVVADEVRKLAERSARAANDIEQVTAKLATQSRQVDKALTTCTTSLDGGVAQLEQLGAVFAHARGAVEAANQGIDDIARAVSEHSGNSSNIASHIDQIAAMAERNSQAVAEAHKATRSLVDLTGQLQTSISRFCV